MTTGTLSTRILADCLKKYGATNLDFPRRFFSTQAQFQKDPWMLATGADFRFPETEGKRPLGSRIFDPYMKTLFLTAATDEVLRRRISEVLNMLRSSSAFFELPIVGRVAIGSLHCLLKAKAVPDQPIPAMPPTPVVVG